jgi:Cu/Ag efflux protein CusF
LPATKEVIKKIDIENKKITVHILEGLLWNLMYLHYFQKCLNQ